MSKRKIVFMNEGGFLPPASGGAFFKLNFFQHLSRNSTFQLVQVSRNFENDSLAYSAAVEYPITFVPPAVFYSDIKELSKLLEDVDFLMFNDAISMVRIGAELKNRHPAMRLGYEAHSIYYKLFSDLNGSVGLVRHEQRLEQKALMLADAIFVRSAEDKRSLENLDSRFSSTVHVARSGVDDFSIKNIYSQNPESRTVLFLGHLNYEPNRQAVEYITKQIAPALYAKRPDIQFVIVGEGMDEMKDKHYDNVNFLGFVPDLDTISAKVDMAICPLTEGSGTRLKLLDYLCRGIPTLTTSKGIEGLDDGISTAVRVEDDLNAYAALISKMLPTEESQSLKALSDKGVEYVRNNRSWSAIIADYTNPIEGLWE